jgi:hypothetical protein
VVVVPGGRATWESQSPPNPDVCSERSGIDPPADRRTPPLNAPRTVVQDAPT